MDSGRREDLGQAVEQLQGREPEGCTAREIRGWEDVEHLVGTSTDEVEAVESEGGPGAISDQALEASSVVALDTDAGVEAKSAAVIPAEHVLGLVGFQEAVAAKMAQHPLSRGMLKALQELGGEGRGFVEL
jgi:hypothetical protein